MTAHRVELRVPVHIATEFTNVGTGVGHRLSPEAKEMLRARLRAGPFLSAFDAGLYDVRDIAGGRDFARLVLVRDRELLDAIDRDLELRRRVA